MSIQPSPHRSASIHRNHAIVRSIGSSRRHFLLGGGATLFSVLFASCTNQNPSTNNVPAQSATISSGKVKVGVANVVTEDILKFVKKEVASNQNLDLEIIKISDWVQINNALQSGEIDVNFFQHQAYMEDAAKRQRLDLVMLNRIYIGIFGLYSKRLQIKSVSEIPANSTVVVHNDPINRDRGLRLLKDNNLINLRSNPDGLLTLKDVVDHPKGLKLSEVEGPAVARSLDDADIGLTYATLLKLAKINLTPIVQAPSNDSKYASGLVTVRQKENNPNVQKLNQLIIDPKVKEFIKAQYSDTAIPVF